VGKPWTEFGKICDNLSLKFVVLIIGEMEHGILCAPASFLLCKKSLMKSTPGA